MAAPYRPNMRRKRELKLYSYACLRALTVPKLVSSPQGGPRSPGWSLVPGAVPSPQGGPQSLGQSSVPGAVPGPRGGPWSLGRSLVPGLIPSPRGNPRSLGWSLDCSPAGDQLGTGFLNGQNILVKGSKIFTLCSASPLHCRKKDGNSMFKLFTQSLNSVITETNNRTDDSRTFVPPVGPLVCP